MELKPKYKLFADTYLSTGDQIVAYQKAYPKATRNSARVKSYTLLQNVTVSAYIKEISYKIETEAQNKLVNKLSDKEAYNLLTFQEKRELLAKIARGELIIQTTKQNWNPSKRKFVVESYPTVPDHLTRLRAIDLDAKLSGEYQETSIKLKGSEQNDGFSVTHNVIFKDSSDAILINNDNDKNVQS